MASIDEGQDCVFKELAEHHIEDEERKIVKRKALSSAEFKNMMKQFEQEKQALKKSLK